MTPRDSTPAIRLVFELTRQDHPRLYDDLIRFPKGTKRINRLRVLAYDGLLVQSGFIAPVGNEGGGTGTSGAAAGGPVTNDLFEPPVE